MIGREIYVEPYTGHIFNAYAKFLLARVVSNELWLWEKELWSDLRGFNSTDEQISLYDVETSYWESWRIYIYLCIQLQDKTEVYGIACVGS
jgi:hypothetical protein